MQPVDRIVYDSDAFRWLVLAADPSPAGLLRLQTAVEQTFPGVKAVGGYRVTNGLGFALEKYSGKHELTTLDTAAFNQLVGAFNPVRSVQMADSPGQVQVLLQFEATVEFCNRLAALLTHLGVTRVAPHSLPSSQVVVLTVEGTDLDREVIDNIERDLHWLLGYPEAAL